jgi:hypothetical protein
MIHGSPRKTEGNSLFIPPYDLLNEDEKNDFIRQETSALMPAEGLSDFEQDIWRASFNELRLADVAIAAPFGGKVIATLATIQTIFTGHSASMSGPIFDDRNDVIVLTCSKPSSDTKLLLGARKSLFPSWNFSVHHHSIDERSFDKVRFVKK